MPTYLKQLRIAVWIIFLMKASTVVGLVEIHNNGYQGLKVAIHREVPEDDKLLPALEKLFKMASKNLYHYTKDRAYLKEITIIVPPTWSSKLEYDPDESDECLKCAEVRIAPPAPNLGNIPYTYQPGSCGERGKFIHFTPDFIRKNLRTWQESDAACPNCNDKARIFVHEWGHLRYGIFNEHSDGSDPANPLPKFYQDKHNVISANGCAEKLFGHLRRGENGKDPCQIDKYGNVDPDCVFFPDLTSGRNDKSKVSLMYLPEMDSTYGFCGDSDEDNALKHNSDAPNMQNLMCKGSSVIDVILGNEDFKDGRNPSRMIPNTDPIIKIVQTKNKNSFSPFVLVLDISGSMTGRPMQYLQDATKRFIRYHAREQCPLGMVSFDSSSRLLANLTQLTDKSREQLIQEIPNVSSGATAIGQGIKTALQLLQNPDGSLQKGKVILITDGEENVKPLIQDILPDIRDSGVTIYSVAFGDKASTKLEDLTTLTNGKGWQFQLDRPTKSLDSSLNEIGLTCGGDSDMKPFINKNGAFKLESGNHIDGIFRIDKNGGGSTEVTVLLTYDFPSKGNGDHKAPEVTLVSPNGKQYTSQSPECQIDPDTRTIRFRLPESEHGNWTYSLRNDGPDSVNVNVMITSDIVYEDGIPQELNPPILVDTWISDNKLNFPQLSKIYATVKKDSQPVVKATVTATLYRPIGDSVTMQLLDNGQDPDTVANDGTYTAYVVQFNGTGRYAIDIAVVNDGEARLVPQKVPGSRAPMLPVLQSGEQLEEPKFDFLVSDFEQAEDGLDFGGVRKAAVDYDSMERPGVFERFATGGTFTVDNWEDKDLIPPSQVRDLTATVANRTSRTVLLEWSSPGDDMNVGQAASVEIRYHEDRTYLIRSFDAAYKNFEILNGSLRPPSPFHTHSLTVQLPQEDEFPLANRTRIHFALRVYDDVPNGGEVSNSAFANFQAPTLKSQASQTDSTAIIFIGCLLLVATVIVAAILLYQFCYRRGVHDVEQISTV